MWPGLILYLLANSRAKPNGTCNGSTNFNTKTGQVVYQFAYTACCVRVHVGTVYVFSSFGVSHYIRVLAQSSRCTPAFTDSYP